MHKTIEFQEPAEIQAALKSYLESGKTTIDNNEFSSECGLMLMGNIPLTDQRRPASQLYFNSLPKNFRESALLDRFHCFIEGWLLPRVDTTMIFKGWTINVENPATTSQQLQQIFPSDIQGSYGVVRTIQWVQQQQQAGKNFMNRYFISPDKVISTSDGEQMVVCNQWGDNFSRFVEVAKDLEFDIVETE